MGNNLSDDESLGVDVTRKAIIPFRVRNNGFQVDYKILKFRSFTKAKVDEATDTKYDDSFLELNTRSRIVGDIRKVFTISAETISEEYATLRKNYYSRIFFGILTFFIGLVLTNIGLVQNELPKGRIMIIFGGLLLLLTFITFIIIVYTDRRLKGLNREFVENCVKILEKEKIVTWTASYQHLLFDIIYPYNGKGGVGAVILTPNPYFEMISKTTDDVVDIDIHVNGDDKKTSKLKLPIWDIDQSISNDGPQDEAPLLGGRDKNKGGNRRRPIDQSLILPPSDDNYDNDNSNSNEDDQDPKDKLAGVISALEVTDEESSSIDNTDDDADNEIEDDDGENPLIDINDDKQLNAGIGGRGKGKGKTPPKAYTGFDDVSKENVVKIHGDLIQRFFHENPEDIEGHGEDTGLLEADQMQALQQPNNGNHIQ